MKDIQRIKEVRKNMKFRNLIACICLCIAIFLSVNIGLHLIWAVFGTKAFILGVITLFCWLFYFILNTKE